MNRSLFYVYIILIIGLMTSCNFEQRKVKKFFKRINAREINSASSYVYIEDHAALYVFNEQFLSKNEVIDFEILNLTDQVIDNTKCIIAKIKCNNCNDKLINYFKERGVYSNGIIKDTIKIKQYNDNTYLSFNWKWSNNTLSNNLKLASIDVESLNVRSGPGIKYKIMGTLKNGDDIIVDNNYNNKRWRKCIFFEEDGDVSFGYISSDFSKIEQLDFFDLGWFGKTGLLMASVIALVVLIIVFPLLLTTIFRSAEDSVVFGLILFGVLLAILYFTYQLIENVLFELFLINLPY